MFTPTPQESIMIKGFVSYLAAFSEVKPVDEIINTGSSSATREYLKITLFQFELIINSKVF
jgi:hypothetical protein